MSWRGAPTAAAAATSAAGASVRESGESSSRLSAAMAPTLSEKTADVFEVLEVPLGDKEAQQQQQQQQEQLEGEEEQQQPFGHRTAAASARATPGYGIYEDGMSWADGNPEPRSSSPSRTSVMQAHAAGSMCLLWLLSSH